MIDSLFAINIFFVLGIMSSVGSKPSIPDIEFTQNATFDLTIFFRLLIPR